MAIPTAPKQAVPSQIERASPPNDRNWSITTRSLCDEMDLSAKGEKRGEAKTIPSSWTIPFSPLLASTLSPTAKRTYFSSLATAAEKPLVVAVPPRS